MRQIGVCLSVRAFLDKFNDKIVVKGHISRDLELTHILFKEKTKPVVFENLDGFRAVGNLWSTRERIATAMGVEPMELTRKMMQAMDTPSPPQEIENAPFDKNILTDFDLKESAIPKFYKTDGGRFVTAGVVIAEHDGIRNMSFHRLMVIDNDKFAIRIVPRHLFALHRRALDQGQELKVAVAVGLCPSIMLSAAMNLEFGKDELTVANSLRQLCLSEPVCVRKLRNGLLAPAFSEYIFEGRITKETADEGPFVDITGTVDPIRKQPVVEIDRIYHRDDAIFQMILPGANEHYLMMGMPREPVIQRSVGLAVPEVHAARLTEGGCCWLHGVVSITKQREGDSINAIMAALGSHPSMKMVTIVDKDINVFDDQEVEWAVATRFQGDRGLVVIENARGSSLDPSAGETTTKVGIDATKPIGGEGFDKVKPQ
jgi:UbiD family decarboxylase